ncbi:long-chain-fatty-acid--CoA ligase [Tumebacillus permanentifrigoris]|uniref:Long-chain acyl-CoA synthetase n=1 Tax=Tumebacillus permanentifrigoris TaxID=378543 RepID=A0A316DD92_9BACL|nr:long-chain-fatty-acid--CoA ligase [Tumebacillus permanentifrigoris]PWK15935.1 long-chain acyl-CoA synthetase [Tumebacillus permanentifrigoris]
MNLSLTLRHSAEAFPTVTAIHFQGTDISYAQLEGAVDAFAAGLTQLGLRQGSKVAILLGNCPQFVIAYYAIARIGAVSVPINPLYTPGELQFILQDAGVEAVVAVAPMAPMFQMMRPTLPDLQQVILVGGAGEGALEFSQVAGNPAELPAVTIDENDLAVVLYTSGTTGKPKGAMLSHRNLVSNAYQAGTFLGIEQTDRVITVLPMFHVFCMTVCLNAPISRGATLIVFPKFSPTETANVAREAQATIFAGVPTMFNFLVQHPECKREDLQSLRIAISGGSAMPVAVMQAFEQKYGVQVNEGYGLSEASPVVCFNPIDAVRKPGTIGLAIIDVEVRLMGEDGQERGVGEIGELICRGPNVMRGYLNRPEETAVTLRDGWLYTGDLATVDEDGYYTIVDRKKDMIIVGGFNVYPREVEEVLFKHPNVAEAAVVGLPDAEYGEKVRAYVALKQADASSTDDLKAYCKEQLASYKVPEEVVILDELPKNTTGKILRRELKNLETTKTVQQ